MLSSKCELVAGRVNTDGGVGQNSAGQNLGREWVEEVVLNGSLEWAGPILWVVAGGGKELLRLRRQFQVVAPLFQCGIGSGNLNIYYWGHICQSKSIEDYYIIDSIDEFRGK